MLWRILSTIWSSYYFLDTVVHLAHWSARCDWCWAWVLHVVLMGTMLTVISLTEKIASGIGLQTKNVVTHFVEIWAM